VFSGQRVRLEPDSVFGAAHWPVATRNVLEQGAYNYCSAPAIRLFINPNRHMARHQPFDTIR
jgi:hypothetical protein